jgi:hypothetical protein
MSESTSTTFTLAGGIGEQEVPAVAGLVFVEVRHGGRDVVVLVEQFAQHDAGRHARGFELGENQPFVERRGERRVERVRRVVEHGQAPVVHARKAPDHAGIAEHGEGAAVVGVMHEHGDVLVGDVAVEHGEVVGDDRPAVARGRTAHRESKRRRLRAAVVESLVGRLVDFLAVTGGGEGDAFGAHRARMVRRHAHDLEQVGALQVDRDAARRGQPSGGRKDTSMVLPSRA